MRTRRRPLNDVMAGALLCLAVIGGAAWAADAPPTPATRPASAPTTAPAGDMKAFEDVEHGFRLKVPAKWTHAPNNAPPQAAAFVNETLGPGEFKDNLTITLAPLDAEVDLPALAGGLKELMGQQLPEFKVAEEGKAELAKRPAHRLVYTTRLGDKDPAEVVMVFAVINKVLCTVTLTTTTARYPHMKATAAEVARSLELLPPPATAPAAEPAKKP